MGVRGDKKKGDLVRTRDGRLAVFLGYESSRHHGRSWAWVPDINKKLLFLTRELDKVRMKRQ